MSPAAGSPPPPAWSLAPREAHRDAVGPADLALMEQFVAFALDPSVGTAARVPFSGDGIRLGLGDRWSATLRPVDVPQPQAWRIEQELFRGLTGPFSALEALQRHVAEAGREDLARGDGDLQVSVGEHPHCASPAESAPPGLGSLRRVSVQPGEASITSCLQWFSVDLFLTDAGEVAAVTLDVWEP